MEQERYDHLVGGFVAMETKGRQYIDSIVRQLVETAKLLDVSYLVYEAQNENRALDEVKNT
jgi:hypothetical protein